MKNLNQKLSLLIMLFAFSVGALQPAMAQGNSANAPGKNKNLGHGNASNGVKAIIQANRQIFYSGDLLEIGVRFPRGADVIQEGEVDAYLVIFYPDTTLQAVSVSNEASTETSNLFRIDEVDVQFLPEGVYQLGVVLTVADGDPLNMSDWYNGMLGLLTVRGLTVSAEPLDIDDDGDGFVDDDTSGDGFVDDGTDEDQADDESSDDGTTDDSTTDGSTTGS
ncbi:MAG: hypothetical protein WD600_09490 [Pseudohongiella sp.]